MKPSSDSKLRQEVYLPFKRWAYYQYSMLAEIQKATCEERYDNYYITERINMLDTSSLNKGSIISEDKQKVKRRFVIKP